MTNNLPTIHVSDMMTMANAVAASGLFGMRKPEEAMALMLIAQAEGSHPAIAIRDYHIIQGKPALKADAMLARFQSAGGKVEWHEMTDNKVSATFSHPAGGSVTIDWDMNRAKAAELGGKGMWKKFPRQMLRARVISEGIRTVFPGVIVGSYTPEEVEDFDDTPQKRNGANTVNNHSTVVEEKKPNLSMALDREQWEQIYDQAMEKMNVVSSMDELRNVWASYEKGIKGMPEDLKADLIKTKDDIKISLSITAEGK